MSEHPLYRQIVEQLKQYLDASVPDSTGERLALVVLGILSGKKASPAGIAKAVHSLGLSGASLESIERRVRRYENDEFVSATLVLHPLVRAHVQMSQQRCLTLVLDPTTQDERVVLLTVGVWYRGRCLPLAWLAWAGQQKLKGPGFWARVEQVLAQVASLLPSQLEVVWLADRAFGTPKFTDIVQRYGWHFIVRVQGQTHYRDSQGHEGPIAQLVTRRGQRRKLRGWAFSGSDWRNMSVIVWWGAAHEQALCVVTDLPPDYAHVQHYRQRYGIECTFRDFKTYGWQWERGQLKCLEHLERLLVGMALATWLALMVGSGVADELLATPPSGKRTSRPFLAKFSLFALGLLRLERWLYRTAYEPLTWRLSQWDAPHWAKHFTSHHTHATLFA